MYYMKLFGKIHIFLFLFTCYVWCSTGVQLLSERHRTEWNWVEYRITLVNTSELPILNPEVHYFAADTALSPYIDDVSHFYSVSSSVTRVESSSDIKLSISNLFYPGDSVEIHFRIFQNNWTYYDCSKDWSYQQNANVVEPNYFMAVYDASHTLLWGSDPLNGNYKSDEAIAWSDRGVNMTITQYTGDSSEIIPAGRFWLFKDIPLSPKERDLLAENGINKLSVGKSHGKILALFSSQSNLTKKLLDSLIAGFYNAVPAIDTIPISIDLTTEDLYVEQNVCDSNNHCHKELILRTEYEMNVSCWDDVSVDECVEAVEICGGTDIGVSRGVILTTIPKDSLQCLTINRNINALDVLRDAVLSNSLTRDGVNISSLQNSEAWQNALQSQIATFDWLKGVEYTGDSIIVGIYDDVIDFDHPDFNEYDSLGKSHARLMDSNEYFGVSYQKVKTHLESSIKLKGLDSELTGTQHGTGDAGIIGSNGNQSDNFNYRGIAPKVHFYPYNAHIVHSQVGHVVNHSHMLHAPHHNYWLDDVLFNNWKSGCTKLADKGSVCMEGDTLVKTVVFAAHNDGAKVNSTQQGYHSLGINAKNPIVVGNITAVEKYRFWNSSMGPTWDGRIKPDVMAPGATSQFMASEQHPFDVWIDYISLYRQGDSIPYLKMDFDTYGNGFIPMGNYGFDTCQIENGTTNGLLHCRATSRHFTQTNLIWDLKDSIAVRPSDEIEVHYKITRDNYPFEDIFGQILFGICTLNDANCKGMYENSRFFVSWPDSIGFNTARYKMTALGNSYTAYYLRLDYSFIRGIVTTDICYSDTSGHDSCGYKYMGDGGTSAAAPVVSGIAALMYQKFHRQTGEPLDKRSMRNSTVKALLIHSAVDMEDSEEAHFACNPDLDAAHHDGNCHYTPYGKGPDFATGWGYVDGKAALDLISDYDSRTKEFPKFKEVEIGNGFEKRWIIRVDSVSANLRVTLVWDDAPGNLADVKSESKIKEPRLINDLDMYLVSPSGVYYYPWRLDPLPTTYIDSTGAIVDTYSNNFENIHETDVTDAYNTCHSSNRLEYECFDHLNNVEVVDVENPELGSWQVVVFGRSVTDFNNEAKNAQVATLVSDYKLTESKSCDIIHDYAPQTDYSCTYKLGDQMIHYVTFSDSTYVGNGDFIIIKNGKGNVIGRYVNNQLAGKKVKIASSRFTVSLHSNNDNSQGWGFAISKIQSIPHSVLNLPLEAVKKKRRTP